MQILAEFIREFHGFREMKMLMTPKEMIKKLRQNGFVEVSAKSAPTKR